MEPIAANLIQALELAPHPEGGHFRRIHASSHSVAHGNSNRPALTAIRYLLAQGECSRWHRVDADECWHWQQGDALELLTYDEDSQVLRRLRLDAAGQDGDAMHVVPAGVWQAARPLGRYTLVACTVSPGFVWEGFQLAGQDQPVAAQLRALGAWVD